MLDIICMLRANISNVAEDSMVKVRYTENNLVSLAAMRQGVHYMRCYTFL